MSEAGVLQLSGWKAKLVLMLAGIAAPRIGEYVMALPYWFAIAVLAEDRAAAPFQQFLLLSYIGAVTAAVALGAMLKTRTRIKWGMIGYAAHIVPGILLYTIQEVSNSLAAEDAEGLTIRPTASFGLDFALLGFAPLIILAAFTLIPALNAFRKWRPA